jgi:hypothetical protein
MKLTRVSYRSLNAKQKEIYNFQKISAVLADYGFTTIKLSDDWNAADFLALHLSGQTLKVQLKGRLTFDAKYRGKDLWVCFPYQDSWYLYPHDELLEIILAETKIGDSASWRVNGNYSVGHLGKHFFRHLQCYKISELCDLI